MSGWDRCQLAVCVDATDVMTISTPDDMWHYQ